MKLTFILILFFITILLGTYSVFFDYEYYQGPKSDHFNTNNFFNPWNPRPKKGLKDLYRWFFKEDRATWPNFVNIKKSKEPYELKTNDYRAIYINHATVLIKWKEINILTDPIYSNRASPFEFIGPKRVRNPGIKFNDLPTIHIVIIGHNHYDHLNIKTLKQLEKRDSPWFVTTLGNRDILLQNGLKKVIQIDWWQSWIYPQSKNQQSTLSITLTPSQHWSKRNFTDTDRTLWGSFFITDKIKSLFFASDTGYSDHFKTILKKLGPVDLALLPIGSYEPRWFMKYSHMNPEEAVMAHKDLASKKSLGIHFGTFQLTNEPIDQPQNDLEAALKKYHLSPHQFLALENGEGVDF